MPASAGHRETEHRALAIGKWANLFMAFAGLVTAWLSRSDAMLVDGLYSAVNFLSAIAAARIGARVAQPPSRRHPWGHDFEEVLYVTFRSLILVGILVFAAIVSGAKIWTFLSGGTVPDLIFGPIVVYMTVIIVICFALSFVYYRAFRKTGGRSALLKTEAQAALIDGALSVGAGAALLSLPYLKDTCLAPYLPIGDAVIVLVLISVIVWQPLGAFRTTLADLAGVSAPGGTHAKVLRSARDLCRENGFKLQRSAVLQAGRMHYAAIYTDPGRPVRAEEIDGFQAEMSDRLEEVLGPVRVEIIVTAKGPLTRSAGI